jgi:ABC-type oligopeptide transport system substrate-binding subunit
MKKALLVMTLASTLILASCGTKPVSSSASETGNSSSDSVSSSSSSSSSSPSPVDPEASYKVSEAEFIDILLNKLANVTVNINGKGVSSVLPKQIVYSGRLEKEVGVFSGSEVDFYHRVDVSGVETGITVID